MIHDGDGELSGLITARRLCRDSSELPVGEGALIEFALKLVLTESL